MTVLLLFSAYNIANKASEIEASNEYTNKDIIRMETTQNIPTLIDEPLVIEKPYSDEDVKAMTLTLAGECYEDKPHDKRLVCEVILNRVSHDSFPDTVLEVVSAPSQFNGYWKQSRDVSENDIEIAEQALQEWHDNDCQPLSEYLYFSAGDNRENVFRKDYK